MTTPSSKGPRETVCACGCGRKFNAKKSAQSLYNPDCLIYAFGRFMSTGGYWDSQKNKKREFKVEDFIKNGKRN